MNKPPELGDLIAQIKRAPRVVTIPVAIVAVVVALAVVAAVTPRSGGDNAAASTPPAAQKAGSGASLRHPSERKSISPPADPDHVLTAASDGGAPSLSVDARSLHVTLPGQQQRPDGLTAAKSRYQLSVSSSGSAESLSILGAQLVDSPTSSFSTLPGRGLKKMVPSRGTLVETWTWWLHSHAGGKHLFVLQLDGEMQAEASVRLDGQTKPAVDVLGYGNDTETGVGSVSLGEGWHHVVVSITHRVPRHGGGMDATANLFVRGPHEPSPVSVTPTAQRNGAGAAPASSVDTETTPEPAREVTSAGGAG